MGGVHANEDGRGLSWCGWSPCWYGRSPLEEDWPEGLTGHTQAGSLRSGGPGCKATCCVHPAVYASPQSYQEPISQRRKPGVRETWRRAQSPDSEPTSVPEFHVFQKFKQVRTCSHRKWPLMEGLHANHSLCCSQQSGLSGSGRRGTFHSEGGPQPSRRI